MVAYASQTIIEYSLFPRQNWGYLGGDFGPVHGYPPPCGSKIEWKPSLEGFRMLIFPKPNVQLGPSGHFMVQSIENMINSDSLILLGFSHSFLTSVLSWHVQTFHFFNFVGFNGPLDRFRIVHFVQLFKPFLLQRPFVDGQHVPILTFVCFHVSSTSFSPPTMAAKWSISINFLFKSSLFYKMLVFP